MSRTAIVTGAAGGIGRAVVARLVKDGYAVAGIDRDTADLTSEPEAEAAVRAAVVELGGSVDALVACAGITTGAPAHQTTLEEWRAVLDANLTSAFLCAKHVLPVMMRAGRGAIVTVGSVLASTPAPGLPAYAAAKAGLAAFTRQLAVDYGRYGVRAVTVSPGWIDTAETRSRLDGPDDEAWQLQSHPLRRLGTPEDVAEAVAFAAGPAAAQLTGTEIVLDGGASAVQAASLLRPGPRARLGLPPL